MTSLMDLFVYLMTLCSYLFFMETIDTIVIFYALAVFKLDQITIASKLMRSDLQLMNHEFLIF